jgi:hypothetical protein
MMKSMSKHLLVALAILGLVTFAGTASADETVSKPGSVTLKTTVVVGRYAKPSVVIEVSRAKATIKLSDLSEPAVEKVLRAGEKAPF